MAALFLAVPVQAQDCGRYALAGVRPGDLARDVRGRLGARSAPTVRLSDASGTFGRDTFDRAGRRLEVTYDDLPDRREARVVHLRTPLADPDFAALVATFGPPSVGRPEDLTGGPAVWVDPGCEVAVTATRLAGRWWDERAGGTFLEVETWASARRRPDSAAAAAIAARETPRAAPPFLVAVVTVPGEAEAVPAPAPREPEPKVESPPVSRVEPEPPPVSVPPSETAEGEPSLEAPQVFTADGAYVPPARLAESYVAPRYPPFVRGARPNARVVLSLTVRDDGSVAAADVVDVTPRGRGFEREALAAARQWRYRPGTLDGRPVESKIEVEIEFR